MPTKGSKMVRWLRDSLNDELYPNLRYLEKRSQFFLSPPRKDGKDYTDENVRVFKHYYEMMKNKGASTDQKEQHEFSYSDARQNLLNALKNSVFLTELKSDEKTSPYKFRFNTDEETEKQREKKRLKRASGETTTKRKFPEEKMAEKRQKIESMEIKIGKKIIKSKRRENKRVIMTSKTPPRVWQNGAIEKSFEAALGAVHSPRVLLLVIRMGNKEFPHVSSKTTKDIQQPHLIFRMTNAMNVQNSMDIKRILTDTEILTGKVCDTCHFSQNCEELNYSTENSGGHCQSLGFPTNSLYPTPDVLKVITEVLRQPSELEDSMSHDQISNGVNGANFFCGTPISTELAKTFLSASSSEDVNLSTSQLSTLVSLQEPEISGNSTDVENTMETNCSSLYMDRHTLLPLSAEASNAFFGNAQKVVPECKELKDDIQPDIDFDWIIETTDAPGRKSTSPDYFCSPQLSNPVYSTNVSTGEHELDAYLSETFGKFSLTADGNCQFSPKMWPNAQFRHDYFQNESMNSTGIPVPIMNGHSCVERQYDEAHAERPSFLSLLESPYISQHKENPPAEEMEIIAKPVKPVSVKEEEENITADFEFVPIIFDSEFPEITNDMIAEVLGSSENSTVDGSEIFGETLHEWNVDQSPEIRMQEDAPIVPDNQYQEMYSGINLYQANDPSFVNQMFENSSF